MDLLVGIGGSGVVIDVFGGSGAAVIVLIYNIFISLFNDILL